MKDNQTTTNVDVKLLKKYRKKITSIYTEYINEIKKSASHDEILPSLMTLITLLYIENISKMLITSFKISDIEFVLESVLDSIKMQVKDIIKVEVNKNSTSKNH